VGQGRPTAGGHTPFARMIFVHCKLHSDTVKKSIYLYDESKARAVSHTLGIQPRLLVPSILIVPV